MSNGRKYTKREAIKIVVDCAKKYDELFANKSILIFYKDRNNKVFDCELVFAPRNFLHLTGLKLKKEKDKFGKWHDITAKSFYKKCLSSRLKESDFGFSEDGTTHLKLDVLPHLMTKNLSASMIGNKSDYSVKLYTEKLIGGQRACMGFIYDHEAYIPNTVLKNDIRDIATDICQIIAIFRKGNQQEDIIEYVYHTKNLDWEKISFPDPYACLKKLII